MTISLGAAVECFLMSYRNLGTRRAYRRSLAGLIELCGPETPLADLVPEMVERWYYGVRDRKTVYENHPYRPSEARELSDHTLANYGRNTQIFFNWCIRREFLEKNPARFLEIKKPPRSRVSKAMPQFVLDRMLILVADKSKFYRYRDGTLLSMLATYGPRCGSLTSLKISQINFMTRWITVRQKGNQDHDLPIEEPVESILRKWLAYRETLDIDPPHDYVFVTSRKAKGNAHQRLTELGLQQITYRLSEQADPNGRRWGPHSVRHWRGQSLADEQVPPSLIQQLLGHSDIKITLDTYCNQDNERLRALVRRCGVAPEVD